MGERTHLWEACKGGMHTRQVGAGDHDYHLGGWGSSKPRAGSEERERYVSAHPHPEAT